MVRDSYMTWEDDHDDAGRNALAFTDSVVTDEEWDDRVLTVLFTATNPTESVSVTCLVNGQPVSVELQPAAARMTERQLEEEISLVADLSRRQALAAQHVLIGRFLDQMGHDPSDSRSFLERELLLPSPEAVREERARVYSSSRFDEPD
jgi:hypothetical protein